MRLFLLLLFVKIVLPLLMGSRFLQASHECSPTGRQVCCDADTDICRSCTPECGAMSSPGDSCDYNNCAGSTPRNCSEALSTKVTTSPVPVEVDAAGANQPLLSNHGDVFTNSFTDECWTLDCQPRIELGGLCSYDATRYLIVNADGYAEFSITEVYNFNFCLVCRSTEFGSYATSLTVNVHVQDSTCTDTMAVFGSPVSNTRDATYIIDGTTPKMTLLPETALLCTTVAKVEYMVFFDMAETISLDLISAATVSSSSIIIKSVWPEKEGDYTFSVKALSYGGVTQWLQQTSDASSPVNEFLFMVRCGPNSAELTFLTWADLPDSTYHGLSRRQYVRADANARFILPPISTNLTACYVESRFPSTSSSSLVQPSGLGLDTNASYVSNWTYAIAPTDFTIHQDYSFYIKGVARGGAEVYSSIEFILVVGCTESASRTQQGVTSWTVDVRDPLTPVLSYTAPLISPAYCSITSHEIIDIAQNETSAATGVAFSCSPQPCTDFQVSGITVGYNLLITFKIKTTWESTLEFTSTPLQVYVGCQLGSTIISSSIADTKMDFFYQYSDQYFPSRVRRYYFIFNQFSCSISDCCLTLTFHAMNDTAGTAHPFLTTSYDAASDRHYVDIPTDLIQDISFYIEARNSFGDVGHTGKIEVSVVFNCYLDTFSMNPLPLEDDHDFNVTTIDALPRLALNSSIQAHETLVFNVSSRFDHIGPAWLCWLRDFRIDYVVNGVTGQNITDSLFRSILTVKSDGELLIRYRQPIEKYQVYLSAYNGMIWTNASDFSWMMELTIVDDRIFAELIVPIFEIPPESLIDLNMGAIEANSTVEIPLPTIISPKTNEPTSDVIVDLTSGPKWAGVQTVENPPSLLIDTEAIGELIMSLNFSIQVRLQDLAKEGSQQYEITLQLSNTSMTSTPGNGGDDLEGSEEAANIKDLKVVLNNADNFGVVELKVSQDLKEPPGGFWLAGGGNLEVQERLEKELQLKILPASDRDKVEGFDESTLDFKWNLEVFQPQLLRFQLLFTSPVQVSPLAVQDKLEVQIPEETASQFFIVQRWNQALPSEHRRKECFLKKQMPPTQLSRAIASAAEAANSNLKLIMILSFLQNVLLMGSTQLMVDLIRALQMILHLPMFQVIIPGNLAMVNSKIIEIAMFDVLPSDLSTDLFLDYNEDKLEATQDELFNQLQDIGYEGQASIPNLGSLSIFMTLYFVKLSAAYLVIKPLSLFIKRLRPFLQEMKEQLFFEDLLGLLLDACIELIISSYLQLTFDPQFEDSDLSGDRASKVLTYTAAFLTLVVLPASTLYVLSKPVKLLKSEDFQARWGALYDGIRMTSKANSTYFAVFILRRFLFCLAAFGTSVPTLQLLSLLLCNLLVGVHSIMLKPQDLPLRNGLMMANEWMIGLSGVAMVLYTDFVSDLEVQYAIGWGSVVIVAAVICLNLIFIVHRGLRAQLLICRRQKTRFLAQVEKLELFKKKATEPDKNQGNLSVSTSSGDEADLTLKNGSRDHSQEKKKEKSVFTFGLSPSAPITAKNTMRETFKPFDLASMEPKKKMEMPKDFLSQFAIEDLNEGSQTGDDAQQAKLGLKPRENHSLVERRKASDPHGIYNTGLKKSYSLNRYSRYKRVKKHMTPSKQLGDKPALVLKNLPGFSYDQNAFMAGQDFTFDGSAPAADFSKLFQKPTVLEDGPRATASQAREEASAIEEEPFSYSLFQK